MAGRMQHMVEDLLDYTRTSFGGLPLRPVRTDLRPLCDATIEELRSIVPSRDILVESGGGLTGVWDPDRLQQAVSNLVGNAIEHGAGPILVRLVGSERDVAIAVHNHGQPIPAEVLPVLFEPFRRGDRRSQGLGLGLFIVREIMRSHGGTVTARSSPEEGTTFVALLPRDADRAVLSTNAPPESFRQ